MFGILLISIFIATYPVLGTSPAVSEEQVNDEERDYGIILTEDKILNDAFAWVRKNVLKNKDGDFTIDHFYKFISATDQHLKIVNEYFTENPEKKPVHDNIDVDQFKTLIRSFCVQARITPVLFVCQLITELNRQLDIVY